MAILLEARTGRELVYKTRRLLPTELVEIDTSLAKVVAAAVPELPRIVGWAVHSHRLHLILQRIEGTQWRFGRENTGRVISASARTTCSHLASISQALGLVSALLALHAHNLIYQDVRVEQLLVIRDEVKLVDVDTIVIAGGICAALGSWLPTSRLLPRSGCDFGTDVCLAGGVIHELLAGHPYFGHAGTSQTIHDAVEALRQCDGLRRSPREALEDAHSTLRCMATMSCSC